MQKYCNLQLEINLGNKGYTLMVVHNRWIFIGALLMALGVALGAFGAHGLKQILPETSLASFKTGVHYHFLHALGILFVALIGKQFSLNVLWPLRFFLIGVILFSGSLYVLAFKSISSMPLGVVGPITPMGGLAFMMGWISLAFQAIKKKNKGD